MNKLTPYMMVQKTIAYDLNYCATDENGRCYAYLTEPRPLTQGSIPQGGWDAENGRIVFLGEVELTCDWKDTLININNITLRNVQ